MPRFSHRVALPGGGVAIMCGHRKRQPCSSPLCGRDTEIRCDYPVKRPNGTPKRGDVRLHRERNILFYVWMVDGQELRIGTEPPGSLPAHMQAVSVQDWFAKSDATCDRWVCSKCVTQRDGLDYCGAHARLLDKVVDDG